MNTNDFNPSYWLDSVELIGSHSLSNDIETDIVIVGGGIAGITTAYFLCKSGRDVVMIDQGLPCSGTTGYTTAKITSQHGLIYKKLVDNFGIKAAREYAQSNENAIDMIEGIIKENRINCDFSRDTSYIYTKKDENLKQISDEATTARKLGINSFFTEDTPLFKEILGAVAFKNQAFFHPLKYLQTLLDISLKSGLKLYQGLSAIRIEEGEPCHVILENNCKIKANYAVIASHYPFYEGNGLYFSRIYPYRSYAIAIKAKEKYPGGMYLSAEDPVRSVRLCPSKDGELIIIGGENHKTGHKRNGDKEAEEVGEIIYFERLEKFAAEHFEVEKYMYRWSTQDYTTMDSLPYIGRMSEKNSNLFIATGFAKWGMTKGTLSGKIISDLILDGESQWSELYTPARFTPVQSGGTFISENTTTAASLIYGKLKSAAENADIKPGEGKIIDINGKKVGVYCDNDKELHFVKTTCPHMGCTLKWNNAERSWDCPCHGSRFDFHGNIVNSPALDKITFSEDDEF